MSEIPEDPAREDRIIMEVVVDAYDEEERAMGWYYYIQDKLSYPFEAQCISERSISPLKQGEKVEVIDMASEDECEREIFVEVKWQGDELSVPLAQLAGIDVDKDTQEAIEDWHYWVARGYEY